MGHDLTNNMFTDYEPQIQLMPEIATNKKFGAHRNQFYPKQVDYRNVIIWRDIYSSIISGYLYHKSGR